MARGDSGRLSEAVPQKTEDSKTASCPLPTPPPRPGLRGPRSPLLSAPHAPDNRTERQGRDEARRPPRGRRWALRPGWGSPGLLGMPGDLCPSWSGEPAPHRGPRRAAGWGLQPQSRQRGAPGRSPGPQAWEPTATPWPCLDRSCLPWTKGVPSPARSPALASLVLGAGPGKGSEGWACHSALPSPLSSLRKGPLPAPGPHASHLPHVARPRDLPLATRFSKALGCSAP